MGAIANIVVNDGETTPVAHTFQPVSSGLNSLYREALPGVPLLGQGSIKLVSKPVTNQGLDRRKITLAIPIMEAVLGTNAAGYTAAPEVAHVVTMNIEVIAHERATAQEIDNVRTMALNILGDSQLVDFLDNRETPY